MSVSVPSENVFLSAISPHTSVSTYAVPSDIQLGHGGTVSDEVAKAKRVQQQVQMRLAEKFTSLPRVNGSSSHYASSEYGGSQTMKYSTYSPGFSSKSQMYTVGRTMAMPRMSQHTAGFSSRSAVEMGPRHKVSLGGGAFHHDDMRLGGGQQSYKQVMTRTMSRQEPETLSVRSLRLHNQHPSHVAAWMGQGQGQEGSEGSLLSDRDATYQRQSSYAVSNGYTQARQTSGSVSGPVSMRRSLSGTLARGGGGGEMEMAQQYQSFKGPAHRTINRIANRNRMSMGSVSGVGTLQHQFSSGSSSYGGGMMMGGSQGFIQQAPSIHRAMSVKSLRSVGKGEDVFDSQMIDSMGNLSGLSSMDMPTAVNYLSTLETGLQVQGAAYIQHECYHNNDAKNQVRLLKGIPMLVQLFTSENQEVQRYATGAMRNIIYENMDNKAALIEAGGIPLLIAALKEQDDELHKNITGILWNLSSKDSLKEKLARETLPQLTEKILIPLSGSGGSEVIQQSPSEADIFYNTTGCLRNLSSVNEKTRDQMRGTAGLVDALVGYIQNSLAEGKMEDKGVENAVCVLRNLSYQLYSEIQPSILQRLEGPTRGQDSGNYEAIGCFTPKSKKAKDRQNQDLSTFTEVARQPKGQEWLWHPQIVGLYNRVLQRCEINTTTREAAAGALQNITAGEKRWASVLSRVAMEQERMLPVVIDLLRSHSDLELRSLTGFLRNLSRHARDKNDMATKVVSNLVSKLPNDGHQKEPSSDVVVNICGALNNLVIGSMLAARDITYFDGLPKLMSIKNSRDNSPGKLKAAKASSTVLCNMFQYKKLYRDYKQKGYTRPDFADMTI
ncbi:plakophilin-3-like isoform X1 [Anguilla rostrata]|uniref:plakophilin-3-like isoform X1 n=1 Tax=Anguilla rostrata TaxID=7938 RepID=UPI0030D161E0